MTTDITQSQLQNKYLRVLAVAYKFYYLGEDRGVNFSLGASEEEWNAHGEKLQSLELELKKLLNDKLIDEVEEWNKMEERERTIFKRIKDNIDVLRQALTMERAERTAFEADSYRSG